MNQPVKTLGLSVGIGRPYHLYLLIVECSFEIYWFYLSKSSFFFKFTNLLPLFCDDRFNPCFASLCFFIFKNSAFFFSRSVSSTISDLYLVWFFVLFICRFFSFLPIIEQSQTSLKLVFVNTSLLPFTAFFLIVLSIATLSTFWNLTNSPTFTLFSFITFSSSLLQIVVISPFFYFIAYKVVFIISIVKFIPSYLQI